MVLSRYQVHSRLQAVGVLSRTALLVYLVCLQKLIQCPTASVKALGVTLSRQREQRTERPAQTQNARPAPHARPALTHHLVVAVTPGGDSNAHVPFSVHTDRTST